MRIFSIITADKNDQAKVRERLSAHLKEDMHKELRNGACWLAAEND